MDFVGENGVVRLWERFSEKLATKVNKVDGLGLSSNDYTTAEKDKLSSIVLATVSETKSFLGIP